MDTNQDFYKIIYQYYSQRIGEIIPAELMKGFSEKITKYYTEQYSRFRVQYPKSAKRYSTFKIEDLDHPEVKEIIINYFKEKIGDGYSDYSVIVLNFSLEDLKEFEKNREEYYNK